MTATAAQTVLPQSYAITKSTPVMIPIIREALSNAKGKVFSVDDIKKLLGKKWVHGFVFYASRERLDPNSAEAFPIVSVKKGRKVVGYRYGGAQDNIKRNAKGHPVKPTNIIGKWESKLPQRALNAAHAAGVEVVTSVTAAAEAVSENEAPINMTLEEEVQQVLADRNDPSLDAAEVEAEIERLREDDAE